MGVWEYECDSGDIYWSQECIKLSGVDCFSPTLDMLVHIVHPDDAARVRSVFDLALTGGMEQSLECRIIRPDGQVAWISARGQVQTNKSGSPARLVGIVQDITEFKRAQENACPDPARKLRCPANSDAASRTSLRWFSS
jgi:PAS domain S-box-containing protein